MELQFEIYELTCEQIKGIEYFVIVRYDLWRDPALSLSWIQLDLFWKNQIKQKCNWSYNSWKECKNSI